jgi:TolB-like protein
VADSARQRLEGDAFLQPVLWRAHGSYALKGFDEALQIREAGLEGVASFEAPPASEKAKPMASPATPVTRRRKLPVAIASVAVLGAAVAYLLWARVPDRSSAAHPRGAAARSAEKAEGDALTVPGFGNRPAIAVLPFDNLSGDAAQEYFADGLAEDLITRLSLWRSFPVIARNSSFVYKGKAVDLKQVSADLGVRYVVEGSVRKAGDRVRIAAQLIDATSGQHVWAETYDRELTDVFAVQDEISSAIAASLVGDLQRAEQVRAERPAPENLEAWGLVQRAIPLIYHFTREDSAEAQTLLERAIAIDPQSAVARAVLAETLFWAVQFGWAESPSQTLDVALAEARRAVALDPRDASAHVTLANVLLLTGGLDDVLDEARRAADLNPSDPIALNLVAWTLNMAGHPPEESIALVQRAMRLSPHDPREFFFYDTLGPAYFNAGRSGSALRSGGC